MAAVKYKHFQSLLQNFNNLNVGWSKAFCGNTFYSSYAPYFKEPVVDKEAIDKIFKESDKDELLAVKIKATPNDMTTSPRYNADIDIFTNYIMRNGKKEVARKLVEDTFTVIKHIQLRKYNKEKDPEKRKDIMLNPRDVFFSAVKNTTPLFSVVKIRKSGSWYKVPVGITEKSARVVAMKWLVEVSKEKEGSVRFTHSLAQELLAASQYEGRAVSKKIELHKLCESNRSYLNTWWA